MLAMILTALAPLTVIGACVGAGIAAIAALIEGVALFAVIVCILALFL